MAHPSPLPDILLNGTSAMPVLAQEMVRGGTSFRGFVDVPICCPSRTSTLSARYSHNLKCVQGGVCVHAARALGLRACTLRLAEDPSPAATNPHSCALVVPQQH